MSIDYLVDNIARREKPEPPMGTVHLHWHCRRFFKTYIDDPSTPAGQIPRVINGPVSGHGYWKVVSKAGSLCKLSPSRCRVVSVTPGGETR